MGKNKKKNNKSGQTSQAVDRPAEPIRQESEDAVSITDDIAATDPIETQAVGTASKEESPVLAELIAKGPARSDSTIGRREVGQQEVAGQANERVVAAATTSEGREDSIGRADTSLRAGKPARGSDQPEQFPAISADRHGDAELRGEPPVTAQRDEVRHPEHPIHHSESDSTAFTSSSPQDIEVTPANVDTQTLTESASPPQSPTPSNSAPPVQASQADAEEAEDAFAALIGSSKESAEAVEETIEAPTATQNAAPEAEGMDERDYGAGQAADPEDDFAAMIDSQAGLLAAPAEKQLDKQQEHREHQEAGSVAQSLNEPSDTAIVADSTHEHGVEDLGGSSVGSQHAGGIALDGRTEDDEDSNAEPSTVAGASSQPSQTAEPSPAVGNPTSIATLISTDSSDHDADDAFARLAQADEAADAAHDEFAAIAASNGAGTEDSEDPGDAFAAIVTSNGTREHQTTESEDEDAFAAIAAAEGSGGAEEEGRGEDDFAAIATSNGSDNREEGRPGDAFAALALRNGTGVGENGEPADESSALLAESEGAGDVVATGQVGVADAWGDSGAGASKWDDLMDEFSELDDPASSDFPSGPSEVTSQQDAASAEQASLFDDDDDFDKILEAAQSEIRQMAAQHPEPHAHVKGPHQAVSAEQLFSGTEEGDASAWLDDTSMDISPAHDQPDTASTAQWTTTTQGTASSSDETALDFDVPEGWVDDDGIFRYYTSEEKAAVRRSMMGEQYIQPEPPAQVEELNPYGVLQRPSSSYYGNSGASVTGASENAARRTPQPQGQAPSTGQTQAEDPYAPIARPGSSAPPAAQPALITPAIQAGFIPAPPAIESYAPAPASSSASYDPYAPGPAGYAAPYTFSSRSMPPSLAPNPPPVAKPAPPMRVASNAYDPPLKPQKSFIRAKQPPPAPATPALPPSFPSPAARAQPTPPPGPPPGPPRRAPSVPPPSVPPAVHAPPAAPPSRPPSAFVPPPPALTVQEEQAPLPDGGSTYDAPAALAPPASGPPAGPPRGPPSRPPSAAAQRRAPSYNSFDPPLKPASVSRPSSRASQRPHFEAPPPVPPLPPAHRAAAPLAHTNTYPDENAARSSQPPRAPPPPGRPASRSAVVPPPPGPPNSQTVSESPRQPIVRMAPPPPPPGPPPRRDSPETPAEDLFQNSGVPVSKGWPHLAGEEDEDDEYGTRADPRGEAPRQTVLGRSEDVTEDLDPEGGMANDDSWDDDRYPVNEPQAEQPYAAPPTVLVQRSSSFGGQAQLSPQSSLGLRDGSADPAEPQSEDSYGPVNGASMPAPPRAAPPPGPPPSFKRQKSTGTYESYERAAGSGATFPGVSPTKSRPPIPSPFMAGAEVSADPYAPSAGIATAGQISEAYTAAIAHPPAQSAYDSPYGPPAGTTNNGYAPTADPYARTKSPVQSGDYSSSAPDTGSYFQSAPGDTSYVPQQVLEQRPVSEDPLGRGSVHAKNVPLAVFGFGGVLVTSFPAQATEQEDAQRGKGHARAPSYGYASVRGKVWIRGVADMASSSSIKNDDGLVFPGPLLYDAATKGVAAEKKKREALTAYLEARADEVERGLPYLKSASSSGGAKKRREEEGKVVLIRVLAAMLLDEGKDGKEKYRDGLVKALSTTQTVPLLSPTATTFAAGSVPYGASAKATKPLAAPSSSQMSTLTELLSTGNKREAAEYAARQGLWPHALILASSVGPDLWRDTVKSFADAELSGEGLGGMKAAYLLFAGGGAQVGEASQVDELLSAANITDDPAKDQWKDVIGSIVLNGQAADAVHLDDLGARFAKKGLHNAAAVCYLLSATSPFADPSPNAVNKPISILGDTPDEDAIMFAEVAEYARSLLPVPKGQEVPFAGLPRLLPYKLQRAWLAAELGETELAVRYCQAVEAASKAIKNGPALLSSHHTASLEDLMERLTGSPSIEPAKNLSARKATAKPGFDKLGSWLEGRLTKFIAGDDETPAAAPKPIPDAKDKSAPVGPFSHFASISPSRSADVSRNPSIPDFGASGSVNSINGLLSAGPPSMGGRSSPLSHASSSYGYDHTQGSPSRRTATLQGYSPFQPSTLPPAEEEAPRDDGGDSEVGELLNPMAALSFGAPASKASYAPADSVPATQNEVDLGDDDEDDLGFGNAGLSRNRTPMPSSGATTETSSNAKPEVTKDPAKEDKSKKAEAPVQDGAAPKKGWLTGWFGKKEEGGGPVRAKLGDENAMVFDPDLKRWVVKGQKPDAAPAAPPPPPRSSTATPAGPSGSSGPPAGTPPTAFNTMPRAATSASLPPGGPPAGPPTRAPSAAPPGAPPGPPGSRPPSAAPPPGGMTPVSGPPKPKGAAPSIDDLLSRPSSKRPGSSAAARKGAKNRYVDVFQQPQ